MVYISVYLPLFMVILPQSLMTPETPNQMLLNHQQYNTCMHTPSKRYEQANFLFSTKKMGQLPHV